MNERTICFSHGQESGPWGTKIRAMSEQAAADGWRIESLDYQGIDSALERRDKLVAWCRRQADPFVLAGSSMGGFVAMAAAMECPPLALFLLAPAFYVPDYEPYMPPDDQLPRCPTTIVHGWRDDVVPWQGSVRYGDQTHARVVLLDGDHRLTANIDEINALLRDLLSDVARAD